MYILNVRKLTIRYVSLAVEFKKDLYSFLFCIIGKVKKKV